MAIRFAFALTVAAIVSSMEYSNDLPEPIITSGRQDIYTFYNKESRETSTVNITDVLYKSVLRFQLCMRDSDNPYAISLLDPLIFSLDHLVHRQTIQLAGTINGTVSDLSQFTVTYLLVTMASKSARMWLSLPQLTLTGVYNVSGSMADTLPLYGSGPFRAVLDNVTLDMTTNLSEDSRTGTVSMSNFTVKFHPANIQVSLGDIFGGGPLGDLIQDFVQDSIFQFLNRARRLITADLRNTTTTAANTILANMTMSKLITYLKLFGNKTDTC